MEDIHCDVSFSGKNDEIAIIKVTGIIDTNTNQVVEKVLLKQIALKKYKLVLDLSGVSYINSAGWGSFLREIKEIRQNDGDLFLVNMAPDVYNVFLTMELDKILKSFGNLKEAMQQFKKK
jgi:anti-anti-sigma factor